MQNRSSGNFKGIDISNNNGAVNFASIKASGIQIVYMKASESNFYRDTYLDQNYAGAKAQGLSVGFYHFFRGDEDPIQQAQFFVNAIKGKEPDCRLVIDLETTEGLNPNELTAAACSFLEEVIRLTGKTVCVYTYTSFASNNLSKAIGAYPLWIADYVSNGVMSPHDNSIWSSWIGFQYASDGQVSGVNGDCDVDEFTQDILLKNEKDGFGVMFNEEYYLKMNPDVAAAVKKGDYPNGKAHYDAYGKKEGRRAYPQLPLEFNEGSYLTNNKDVAAAVKKGDYVCGAEHWMMYGWNEKQRKYSK